MKKDIKFLVSILLICLISLGFSISATMQSVEPVPSAEEIAAHVIVPTPVNYTGENILELLNEDDNWEDEAISLVKEDLRNKDIYRFMNIDKDNFEGYEILDEDVLEFDTDDEDADVQLKLRVEYFNEYRGMYKFKTIYVWVKLLTAKLKI